MKDRAVVNLRLPPKLKAALERAAKEDHRSLNNYVERVLVEAMEARGYLKG